MAECKAYSSRDYEALCRFLRELNQDSRMHINWNWARLEWMIAHPEFDADSAQCMGLWWDSGRIVAAALYDMYFGEGFCGVLPGFEALYPQVLAYGWEHLRDENGFGLAVCDSDEAAQAAVRAAGFAPAEQGETIMAISLNGPLSYDLPEGFRLENFAPAAEPERFQWILWRGFDHGMDREAFLREETIRPQLRPHLKRELSVAAVDERGETGAYCCVWYDEATDYAYVEPVCTSPDCRGKGLGRAVVYEALNRASRLGAKTAYVISDQPFYQKLGFDEAFHFTFYWKKA